MSFAFCLQVAEMQREVGARLSPATQAFLKRRALARSQGVTAASPDGAAQPPMDGASGAVLQQQQQEQAPAKQPQRSSQQQTGMPSPHVRPQQGRTGAATDIVRGVRFALHGGKIVAAIGAEDSQEQAWDAVVQRDPLRCALGTGSAAANFSSGSIGLSATGNAQLDLGGQLPCCHGRLKWQGSNVCSCLLSGQYVLHLQQQGASNVA